MVHITAAAFVPKTGTEGVSFAAASREHRLGPNSFVFFATRLIHFSSSHRSNSIKCFEGGGVNGSCAGARHSNHFKVSVHQPDAVRHNDKIQVLWVKNQIIVRVRVLVLYTSNDTFVMPRRQETRSVTKHLQHVPHSKKQTRTTTYYMRRSGMLRSIPPRDDTLWGAA